MQLTAKANTICILEILKEYSDGDNPLTIKDIIHKMKLDYDLHIADKRTVRSCIYTLSELGYDIYMPLRSDDEKPKKADEEEKELYYLASREWEFDVSEVRLLTDSIYSNPGITDIHSRQLIEKLQKMLPQNKRHEYKNLSVANTGRKTDNKKVFLNIDYLDEAISKRKKVAFIYMKYDFDKRLKPRREEKYVVSPYEMVAANENYYLLCKCDSHETPVSQFRIDKITDVEIIDGEYISPPWNFSPKRYRDQSIFMYGGKVGQAVIRCENHMLDQVIDRFGQDIEITKNNDGKTFDMTVTGSLEGLGYWAGHYIDCCEVLKPQSMREAVIDVIKNNKYNV